LKVEVLERVGFGWTGPRERRRALSARSGSEESRLIPMMRVIVRSRNLYLQRRGSSSNGGEGKCAIENQLC